MNRCTTCGADFGSLTAFDAHRRGKFRQKGQSEYSGHIDDWTREKGRRCLDEEEMAEKRLVRNARGTWSLERDLERGRALRATPGWERASS